MSVSGRTKKTRPGPAIFQSVSTHGLSFSFNRLAASPSMRTKGSTGRQKVSARPRMRPYHSVFQPYAKYARLNGSVSIRR